jgi:hypothetical protein
MLMIFNAGLLQKIRDKAILPLFQEKHLYPFKSGSFTQAMPEY